MASRLGCPQRDTFLPTTRLSVSDTLLTYVGREALHNNSDVLRDELRVGTVFVFYLNELTLNYTSFNCHNQRWQAAYVTICKTNSEK